MFEGFVSQVLAGYLGRYVKGIQRDQLKIGIWNEEVLLENVELILEAFDYLQLPFALRQGKIGKLSIKIPWKKLGWDPIIIQLEDVFICASSRDCHEWNRQLVEKRELAGKMAKLNAAELAKFSKRVYGNQVGHSFLAKILDNIQVSIKNVHIMYVHREAYPEKCIFGLRFSSLIMMTDTRKQNSSVSSYGKLKGSQVKKILKISTFGIYCNLFEENAKIDDIHIFSLCCDSKLDPKRYDYLINPFDLTVSLWMNKFGMLDTAPQYSVMAELASVVVLLNEIQLQQILSLWDHFLICSLRERYGRFRPDGSTLSKKVIGWQIFWWHYAQQSILSDVRRRLRKTSWSSLGRRINYRRKYVDLYRRKLELIQKNLHVSKDILDELEQMDKECEIDEILSYRTIAENQIQASLLQKEEQSAACHDINTTQEKEQADEWPVSRLRGWLNWLSLGMLGAGGTTDSSSFAGLVSDEIIKDIYDATDSQLLPDFSMENSTRNKVLSSLFKFDIDHFTMTISSREHEKEITLLLFDGVGIECKLWEDFVVITVLMKWAKIVNPCNDSVLLTTKKVMKDSVSSNSTPFLRTQIKVPQVEQGSDLSVEGILQCIEVTYDSEFLDDVMKFQCALDALQLQNQRVISSFNSFEQVNARLLSKAEYIFLTHKRVTWDIRVHDVSVKIPQPCKDSEPRIMILNLGNLHCTSRPRMKSDPPMLDVRGCSGDSLKNFSPTFNLPSDFELQDLYDHVEISLIGLEGIIMVPGFPHVLHVFERFDAFVVFWLCILLDEPVLRPAEGHCSASSISVHLSPLILGALVDFWSSLLWEKPKQAIDVDVYLFTPPAVHSGSLNLPWFSVSLLLNSLSLHIHLEDGLVKNRLISVSLADIDIRYAFWECLDFHFSAKMLKVSADVLKGVSSVDLICSCRSNMTNSRAVYSDEVEASKWKTMYQGQQHTADGAFLFCYQTHKHGSVLCHKCDVLLNDTDFYIHPGVLGICQESYSRIFGQGSCSHSTSSTFVKDRESGIASELQNDGPLKFVDPMLNASTGTAVNHSSFLGSICTDFPGNTECPFISSLSGGLFAGEVKKGCPRNLISDIITRSMIVHQDNNNIGTLNSRYIDIFFINFHLNEVRVHFHDLSGILATISSPLCTVTACFQVSDSWDILCYTDGLKLSSPWSSSSWSSPNIPELLWGPASPSISPILNIHVKKGGSGMVFPAVEISIAVQHVCCTLPYEFLSMMIGYFSLPVWTRQRNEVHVTETDKCEAVCHLQYKFEILNSTLIIPIENCKDYCLQLGVPKLHCDFILRIHSVDALRGIPSDCLTPNIKLGNIVNLVNVFGRDISLAILLLEDGYISLTSSASCIRYVSLISKLDADLWIRIPYIMEYSVEQYVTPTFIMMKVDTCNFVIDDEYFIRGLEATGVAIDMFSNIGNEARHFESDALQFIELKRKLKEVNNVKELSTDTLIDIRVCANSMSVKLRGCFASSDLMAIANMKGIFSIFLRNESVYRLNIYINHVDLHSFPSKVVLLSFNPHDFKSSVIEINFSKSEEGENELNLCIPLLEIWLHLSDWSKVIDLLCTIGGVSNGTSLSSSSSPPLESKSENAAGASLASTFYTCENVTQEAAGLTLLSDKIVLSFHCPLHQEHFTDTGFNESQNFPCHSDGENVPSFQKLYSQYLTVLLRSRDVKLMFQNRDMVFKYTAGRVKATAEITKNFNCQAVPVFEISLINLVAEIDGNTKRFGLSISDVLAETLDIHLSKQICKIWISIPSTDSGTSHLLYSVTYQVCMRKFSLLLSDHRWRCNGSIFDITLKDMLIEGKGDMKLSVDSELSVSYNNMQKVMWESFIEPWKFHLNLIKHVDNTFLSQYGSSDIVLDSQEELNLNVTESVIEDIYHVYQMLNGTPDVYVSYKLHESPSEACFKTVDSMCTKMQAPYIICNDTSLPLQFWVSYGHASAESTDILSLKQGNIVQPGFSVPIYVKEPTEKHSYHKAGYSSDRLLQRKANSVAHHLISVRLDGASKPSKPMSMDLVGISYFEVNFSKSHTSQMVGPVLDEEVPEHIVDNDESNICHSSGKVVVPVVFDVSMHCYKKMIRLYSTVKLLNSTAKSLELRFDIPFGVSPKILGPICPGQEFPLPVHLAETVGMRWRPVDSNYFWSEAHSLSKILSHENKLRFMRSFVCYPSSPKSDPFRCCISVQDCSVLYPYDSKGGSSLRLNGTSNVDKKNGEKVFDRYKSKKRFVRQVKLTTPLLVKNGLPTDVFLTIDCGGLLTSICVSEVDIASIFQIDSTHDLDLTFHLQGYHPATTKFPRAETFTTIAKLDETIFLLSEKIMLHPISNNGSLCLRLDKFMDAFGGAREICISVPFLLYNCTDLHLGIIYDAPEHKGHVCKIESCYCLIGDEHRSEKHGVSLISLDTEKFSPPLVTVNSSSHLPHHDMPARKISKPYCGKFMHKHVMAAYSSGHGCGNSDSLTNLSTCKTGTDQSTLPVDMRDTGIDRRVKACLFAPFHLSESDPMVRLQAYSLQHEADSSWDSTCSSPFPLLPESGSTNVIIPQPGTTGAFLVSATLNKISGDLSGRTRAMVFQPRFVICNACSKDLYYKQKGTSDSRSSRLGVGQHSHLHWADRTRDLLVCIRFDERGGQWSGSFLPDLLGDAQVKVRNYASGALEMVRVEIQNADLFSDDKVIGASNGNSGTYLIILSDDDSGSMPYRINNFSMEILRIYQYKCETAEAMVHSYTSYQYAWDEPSYPHRLIIEVPGERILGSFCLDDVKEYPPICLAPSSEKPERRLFISVHAEGATKVLSVIDSCYHSLTDIKKIDFQGSKEKRKLNHQKERSADFCERIIFHFPFIGASLVHSSPQELIYACAKETKVILVQSSNKQKVSFQISSLQVDNQLPGAPYPILLSFDQDYANNSANLRHQDYALGTQSVDEATVACEKANESNFSFAASKWRKESSFVSYEYINLRVAPLRVELEEQVLLQFLGFLGAVTSRLQNGLPQNQHFNFQSVEYLQNCKVHLHNDNDEVSETCTSPYHCHSFKEIRFLGGYSNRLPPVVPIGAPWQQIYRLAKRQKKIYIEAFELAPVKLSVSFSSNPWLVHKRDLAQAESFFWFSGTVFQRGLMALVDVEGVPFHLGELSLTHIMASQESIQEIVTKHYTRQFLHELYKVFGSVGLIGNPMGFARNVGFGIKDFLSFSSRSIVQSPSGLITGVAQGSKSLLGNTVYAVSSAASQFSKAVHKGIVALTFDEQSPGKMEIWQNSKDSQGNGILNEFLEGLTGLLQSPIKGAEKHGLPGVVSGIVLGTAGLVGRPMASILETTGKAAQSIRKRSSPHQARSFRIRLPRPLARDLPLSPYSWEEAIGVSMLLEADNSRFKDEIFVKCRALKQDGKFIVMTETLVIVFSCPGLVGLGKPGFIGIGDLTWVIEMEMCVDSIMYVDRELAMVNIIGSRAETLSKRRTSEKIRMLNTSSSMPLFQMSVELCDEEKSEDLIQTLYSIIEQANAQKWNVRILHRSDLR